jgi:excisionase family DNA binding protein
MAEKDDYLSMGEACRYIHVGRAAIYAALKKGRLHAIKIGYYYAFAREELDRYRLNKYNRDERRMNGERIFDVQRGTFSVHQASKILSDELKVAYNMQRLYHLIRTGQLKVTKCGATFVISRETLIDLIEKEKQIKNPDYRQFKFGRKRSA